MYMYTWISFSLPGIGRDKRCVEALILFLD